MEAAETKATEVMTWFVCYYDYGEIEFDRDWNVVNMEVIYIAEYDEEDNFIRRVDLNGNEIEMDITVEEMERMDFIGDGKDNPAKSFECLKKHLDDINEEYMGDVMSCTMVPYGDTWVEYWS